MATSSPSPASTADPSERLSADHSQLIGARLQHTRRYVKLVDVCTGIALLLAGILSYLLAVALIDHWVVDLTRGMRLAALLVLLLGSAGYVCWRLLPPLLYQVNPVFAAQTIEHAAPSLKNSLINLVLLAKNQQNVPTVIFDGLRRQAAVRLAQVPPDTMVDRAPLIHAGYWLVAVLVVAAGYKLLSPKDPLQSVARIASPWKSIDRPSRVRMTDVLPGDVQVYRGQTIDVTARIEGLSDDEGATLRFSTHDGRFIDCPAISHDSDHGRARDSAVRRLSAAGRRRR
jgi:hypothetical protein